MIALAVLSVACAKEKENDIQTPAENVDQDGAKTIVFTAQVPTRTTIDANDQVVSWSAGDEVKFVWDGGSATATASAAGSSTTFTVTVPDGVTELYAVYPAAAGGSYDSGNVNVHFNGSRSDGSFAANDISFAKATKSGDNWSSTLAFKNAACLLKVGVTSSSITKLQVFAGNGETIVGYLPLSIDGSGNPVIGVVSDSPSDHVTMTVSGPGNYYIPVLPGVTLSSGFQVKLFEGDNQLTPFFYNGSFTTERGKVIKLNDIEAHAGQYYVTPSGAGSKAGQSWTNAMDAAQFKSFIENQDNYFLLKGATFHLSAEEFTFGDYLQPSFADHSEVAFTIEGTKSGSDITTFVGGTGDPAGTLWPKTNCNLTVKNVKFTGTNGNSNRGAVRLNTSSAKLGLESCVFDGNKTSGSGGAIVLFKAAKLDIKDCDFIGNSGSVGAALYFEAQADLTVTVSGGIFRNNYTTGDGAGSVVYAKSNGGNPTVDFTDVTFNGNYYKSDTNDYGGIINICSSDGLARFNQCVFDGNYQTGSSNRSGIAGSAILLIKKDAPTIWFNACEFKNNYSVKGHQAMLIGITYAGATLAMNNCSFSKNYSSRNSDGNASWIQVSSTSANLIVSNTTIVGDQQRSGATSSNVGKQGVIKLEGSLPKVHLINNILCSPTDGASIRCTSSDLSVNSYYNKTSKEYSGYTIWGTDTGSGHDYTANSTSFGSWSAPYTWNGTMTGTNSDMKAATADVNTEIQNADADFYAWLDSIGALGKDINGNDRGATSWPGCYQN